LTFNTI